MNSSSIESLDRYIRARYPIIALISHEESRVIADVKAVASARKKNVVEWSITTGLIGEGFEAESTRDPLPAFEAMMSYFEPDQNKPDKPATLFIMKDLHGVLGNRDRGFDPVLTRLLRDIASVFSSRKHTLVLLSPAFQIPPELEKTIVLIDWPLPEIAELTEVLERTERDLPENFPVTLNGSREALIQSMRGLTAFEAESVLLSGIVATKGLGDNIIPFVVREKAQIIRKAGVLEYFDTDVTMKEVGGLNHLKKYAAKKRRAFSADAGNFGVDAPKGVLLVGIPGTGKSLAAKAIAGGKMPLLRMDVGALMGGLFGQSESNMRAALKVAEAVAPAVLWIDELEKAIGSGGDLDGGTSARVFGTLLTWMQETSAPVYVVATANDIRGIRPELIRRFDDMFFVDLPNLSDRIEILRVHIAKRKHDPELYDLEAIALAVWGFSGGEIEKVVKSALETAFFEETALTNKHLLTAAGEIIPIAVTMKDQIDSLREQSKTAKQAGEPIEAKPEPATTGRKGSRIADLADL